MQIESGNKKWGRTDSAKSYIKKTGFGGQKEAQERLPVGTILGLEYGLTFYSAFFEYFRFSFRLLGLEEHFIPSLSIFYRVVQKLGRFECGDLFIWSRCLKNRKISKNLKKSSKYVGLKNVKNRVWVTQWVFVSTWGVSGGLWRPFSTFLKNIFFDFFPIFRHFGWLRWFANFRFRARRPPQSARKVPNPLLFEFPDI